MTLTVNRSASLYCVFSYIYVLPFVYFLSVLYIFLPVPQAVAGRLSDSL